jgi:GT2 family glycosyltransferase
MTERNDRPEIALVIPFRSNPNREDRVLRRCLRAWAAQAHRPAVIVLADGSPQPVETEDSENLVHLHVPYAGPFNAGFLRNVGLRRAVDLGFAYVQLMDADLFPASPHYLTACLQLIRHFDLILPYAADVPVPVPDFTSPADAAYRSFVAAARSDPAPGERRFFSYALLFMRAVVPRALHGFDEAYQVWGGEDDDYLVRALQAGFRASRLHAGALVHARHVQDTVIEAKLGTGHYRANLERLARAKAGLLPLRRMPADWGLAPQPRPVLSVPSGGFDPA